MAKGKPYSDSEIRPETPEILRYLERQHYDSPEWSRGAGIRNRGLGNRIIEDDAADSVTQIEQLPSETTKGRI